MTTTTQPAATEMLPCPYCGSEAEVLEEMEDRWYKTEMWHVECSNRLCLAVSDTFMQREEAITWWNRRAPNTTDAATIQQQAATIDRITAERDAARERLDYLGYTEDGEVEEDE